MNIEKLPKWAQEHIRDLQTRIAHLEGIPNVVDDCERDLPPPENSSNGLTRGYDFNIYSLISPMGGVGGTVRKYCSSSVYHGSGWEKTSSQRPLDLYSTERRAWIAAKAAFVKWASETVAKIDERIKKASDTPYQP